MNKRESFIEQMVFGNHSSDASFEDSQMEYELEVYLEGFDIEEFKSQARLQEGQEQWGIYIPKTAANASSGSERVRKTSMADGDDIYVYCLKAEAGDKGKLEVPLDSNPTHFEQFKRMADQGLLKTRYTLPGEFADGTKFSWEVDIFYNRKGELVPWAKIDIELEHPRPDGIKPEEIPFTHKSLIVITPEMKAEGKSELLKKAQKLYTDYFVSKNAYV